jgi:hypothetical protein
LGGIGVRDFILRVVVLVGVCKTTQPIARQAHSATFTHKRLVRATCVVGRAHTHGDVQVTRRRVPPSFPGCTFPTWHNTASKADFAAQPATGPHSPLYLSVPAHSAAHQCSRRCGTPTRKPQRPCHTRSSRARRSSSMRTSPRGRHLTAGEGRHTAHPRSDQGRNETRRPARSQPSGAFVRASMHACVGASSDR